MNYIDMMPMVWRNNLIYTTFHLTQMQLSRKHMLGSNFSIIRLTIQMCRILFTEAMKLFITELFTDIKLFMHLNDFK